MLLEHPAWPYLLLTGAVSAHACWNLLARHHQPSSAFLWWAVACYCVLAVPFMTQSVLWTSAVWPYMLLTGLLNGMYFVALGVAYQHMPASLVYPLARSSPLLLVGIEIMVLDSSLSGMGMMAIIVATSGILLLMLSATGKVKAVGIWCALLAACATTGYTLSDHQATRHGLHTVSACLGYVGVTYGIGWLVMCLHRRSQGSRLVPPRPPWKSMLLAGVCVGLSYALVIAALRYLPAAVTVTWTNTGVIVGVILAMVWLRERDHMVVRLAAVSLSIVGLIMLALSG